MRPRKLLMHRRQIRELRARMRERGYTVVPTMVYLKDGKAKVEVALAKGKRQYDKREAIAKRDSEREVRQAMKERGRE
jgi:SsrA-binding protein